MKRADLREFIIENKLLKTIPDSGCGIYAITIDGWIAYIGQSKDLYRRCAEHIYNVENAMLSKEKKYLLLLSAKLGGHTIDCHLIEKCDEDDLLKRERLYINEYKPILNTVVPGNSKNNVSNLKIEDILFGEKYLLGEESDEED